MMFCFLLGSELDPTQNKEPVGHVEDENDPGNEESDDSHDDAPDKEMELKASEYSVCPIYQFVVPIGKETVKAVLKVLVYLWECQWNDPVHPNMFPKPCDSIHVEKAKQSYFQWLVHDSLSPWPDHAVYCVLHDGYMPEDFLRMMVTLWKGFEKWDSQVTLI